MKNSTFIFLGIFWCLYFVNNANAVWEKSGDQLICKDSSGKIIRSIILMRSEKEIAKTAESVEKDISVVIGSVSVGGMYSWVISKEFQWRELGGGAKVLFQYFDSNGVELWKSSVTIVADISNDGKVIFALQSKPEWINSGEYQNIRAIPVIYDWNGKVIERFSDCGTYDSWRPTENRRYYSITCRLARSKQTQHMVYDTVSGKYHVLTGGKDLSLSNDGSYRIFDKKLYVDPLTKKRSIVTDTVGEGKIK